MKNIQTVNFIIFDKAEASRDTGKVSSGHTVQV